MIVSLLLSVGLMACWSPTPCQAQTVETLQAQLVAMEQKMEMMTSTMKNLARQTMTQQFASEERSRADGDSGIREVRGGIRGPDNYYSNTHVSSGSFMSMHDHSNYASTIGLGEISVSLNGVDFRTRHNDYKLKMASTTSGDYHEAMDVPFPSVPEAVSKLEDVDAQIVEMREWFKAFKDQNSTVRDYRKFFKPVLCYLEGTWTLDQELDEPFESDRHHLDASSWFELLENVRYNAYAGTKNRLENFAYLPTAIMSVNETTGLPNYAQWNYRIMCHPLKEDLPLEYLKLADDLSFRYPKWSQMRNLEDMYSRRGARYKLYEFEDKKFVKYTLLDRLMSDIPGLDNLPGDLREDSFGDEMYDFEDTDTALNSGYYHRMYKFSKPGAMGQTTSARGYNDDNCWVAMTTQKRVAPMNLDICKRKIGCLSFSNRFSFAIPLEIIYLTPLLSWNPWDLQIHDELKVATADGRSGSDKKPLNGVDGENYYITPTEFFKGSVDTTDPADTVKNAVRVVDKNGDVRVTTASGTKIILQEMEGVGNIRLRFPIAPVYGEGSSVWKELNALKDYVFKYGGGGGNGEDEEDDEDEDDLPEVIEFETEWTSKPTDHFHTFSISRKDYLDMKDEASLQVLVTTSEAAGHTHDLAIRYHFKRGFEYTKCDDLKKCWDNHPRRLIEIKQAS